jgi:hypothetical protein
MASPHPEPNVAAASYRHEREIERNRKNEYPSRIDYRRLSGIGRAAAAFAKKGAGRREEAGKALVKELRSFGSEAEFINADVRGAVSPLVRI